MFTHKQRVPECAHTYNHTATTKEKPHTYASKQQETRREVLERITTVFLLRRRWQQQQQQMISVRRVIKTHRNQGCWGTQVRLIQLIVQLSLKNGSRISLTARGTKSCGNAHDWFRVFVLQNLLRLVRRKLEHGRNHFGHCLQMKDNQKKKKSLYLGNSFGNNNLRWHDQKEKNKKNKNKPKTNKLPGLAVQFHERTHKHKA